MKKQRIIQNTLSSVLVLRLIFILDYGRTAIKEAWCSSLPKKQIISNLDNIFTEKVLPSSPHAAKLNIKKTSQSFAVFSSSHASMIIKSLSYTNFMHIYDVTLMFLNFFTFAEYKQSNLSLEKTYVYSSLLFF